MSTTSQDNDTRAVSSEDAINGKNEKPKAPNKRTQTKIKNRKTSGKRRYVYANLPLPKNMLDRGQPNVKYVSNRIVTSKYTFLTFIPKNLFEQFRKAANLYFLLMAVLGMIPAFSSNSPILNLLPISTVVFFTACKDAVEDRNRHKIDAQFNGSICYHLRNFINVNYPDQPSLPFWKKFSSRIKTFFIGLWKKVNRNDSNSSGNNKKSKRTFQKENVENSDNNDNSGFVLEEDSDSDVSIEPTNAVDGPPIFKKAIWKNIRVGDFLFLRNGDAVPADSIIISTSEPAGTCFVETKDLDGETNLKPRRCVPDMNHVRSPADCTKLNFWVESEAPNSNLFNYSGTLYMPDNSEDSTQTELRPKKSIPLDINNLLLRAHVIRNTEWVIAMIIYTGVETKIMLNSGETPSKRSRIDKEMNYEVTIPFSSSSFAFYFHNFFFVIVFFLCVVLLFFFSNIFSLRHCFVFNFL